MTEALCSIPQDKLQLSVYVEVGGLKRVSSVMPQPVRTLVQHLKRSLKIRLVKPLRSMSRRDELNHLF
ncbi:hypothetical protein FQR65_LT16072 [Abscondita terminalis]|nr:hypothetical protein FQR65_LT16072 [Abscondita terminalis]